MRGEGGPVTSQLLRSKVRSHVHAQGLARVWNSKSGAYLCTGQTFQPVGSEHGAKILAWIGCGKGAMIGFGILVLIRCSMHYVPV